MGKGMQGVGNGFGSSPDPTQTHNLLSSSLSSQAQTASTGDAGINAQTAGGGAVSGNNGHATSYQNSVSTNLPSPNGVNQRGVNRFALSASQIQTLRTDSRTVETRLKDAEKDLASLEEAFAGSQLMEVEVILARLDENLAGLQEIILKSNSHPQLQWMLGQVSLFKAKMMDLTETPEQGVEFYHKAVFHLDNADKSSIVVSSLKPKIIASRHEAKVALGDYTGALEDEGLLLLATPLHQRHSLKSTTPQWEQRIEFLKYKSDLLGQEGKLQEQALLLSEAIRLEEALGREVSIENKDYLKRLALTGMSEELAETLQEQVNAGGITPEVLDGFDRMAKLEGSPFYQTKISLTDWVKLEQDSATGGYEIFYTDLLSEAPMERRVEVLAALQELAVAGEIRSKALQAQDPVEKAYFESQVALLDGNLPLAKLKLHEVWQQKGQATDEISQALVAEAGEQLRQFSLAHVQEMKANAETLYFERHEGNFDDGDKRREDCLYDNSMSTLLLLEGLLSRGEAHTIEEALQMIQMKAEAQRGEENIPAQELKEWDYLSHFSGPDRELIPVERRVDSFLYNSANPEIGKKHAKGDQMAIEGGDKYFYKLLQLETAQVWEQAQTEDGARQVHKEVGDLMRVWRGWGSEQIATKFYEQVMSADMAKYADQVEEGVLHEANNIFTEKKLKEQIEEQLEALKEEDPGLYAVLYPKGKPTEAQRRELLEQVKADYIEHRTKQEIFRILHQKGLSDPLAKETWLNYRSMTDILDETGVISDAGMNAIIKEAIITAITLPVTMGAGQLARNTILASKVGKTALGSYRFSKIFYYSAVLGSGAAVEGVVMELQHAALTGKFNAKSIGHNIVMTLAFHRMGKVWQAYSKHLGIDDLARAGMTKAGKVWQARGLKVLDTAGMLNLQTLAATIASDPENRTNIVDGYLGHFARNLGFHYGAAAMRGIAPEFMALEGKLLAQYGQNRAPWEKVITHYNSISDAVDLNLSKTDLVGSSEYNKFRNLMIHEALRKNLVPEQVEAAFRDSQALIRDIQLLARLKELPREQQLGLLRQEGQKKDSIEAYFKEQDAPILADDPVTLLEDSEASVIPRPEDQAISVEEAAVNTDPSATEETKVYPRAAEELTQVSEEAGTSVSAGGETSVFDRMEDGKTEISDLEIIDLSGHAELITDGDNTGVVTPPVSYLPNAARRGNPDTVAGKPPMVALRGEVPSKIGSHGQAREGIVKLRIQQNAGEVKIVTPEGEVEASTLIDRARLAINGENPHSEAVQFLESAINTVNYWQGVFKGRGISAEQLAKKDIPEQYFGDYHDYQDALNSLKTQYKEFEAKKSSEGKSSTPVSITPEALRSVATSGPASIVGENSKGRAQEISVAERVAEEWAREGQLTDPGAETNVGPARAPVGEETNVVTPPTANPNTEQPTQAIPVGFNRVITSLEMLAGVAPPLADLAARVSGALASGLELIGKAPPIKQPLESLKGRTPAAIPAEGNVANPGSPAANKTPVVGQEAVGHGFMHDPAADISQIYFSAADIQQLSGLTPDFYLSHEIMKTEQGTYYVMPEALERALGHMVHASRDPSRQDFVPYKIWIPRLTNALRQQSYRNPELRGRVVSLLESNGYNSNGIPKDAMAVAGARTDMNPWAAKGTGDLALLAPDYQSLAKARPSDVGKIQHLTKDLEKAFDRGAKVIKVGNHYLLVEPTAGSETSRTKKVSLYEAEAYQQWYQIHGFQPVSFKEAYSAWMSLGSRGIEIFYHQPNEGFIYRPDANQLNKILAQHGAQIVYLNKLLNTLPKSVLEQAKLKNIVLNSPRFDSESQWADYNPDNQSLSLYSGAFAGSRRHLAAVFLHELGHTNAAHYPQGSRMRADYDIIRSRNALFGLDILDGAKSRKHYQEKNFDEFLAELHLIYRVSGRELRAHIKGLTGYERQAWDRVYNEMRVLFGGEEYGVVTRHEITATGNQGVRRGSIALKADAEQGLGSMAAYTHEGIGYKPVNEDAVGAVQLGNEGRWVAVADGAGGYGGGDKASKVAVEAALDYAVQGGKNSKQILENTHNAVRTHPNTGNGMATITLYKVSTKPSGERWLDGAIAGDAGLVVFRLNDRGEYYPEFISKDDGPVAQHFENYDLKNRYDPQDQNPHRINTFRRAHPKNNVIFNAVGGDDAPDIQSIRRPLQSGDVILAGSDGIFDNMSPYEIAYRLNQLRRRTGVTPSGDEILGTLQQEVETKMRRFNQLVVKNGNSLIFKNPSQVQTINAAEPDYLGGFLAEKVQVVPYRLDTSGNATHYLSRRGAVYEYDSNLGYYVVSDFIKLDNLGMSVEVVP